MLLLHGLGLRGPRVDRPIYTFKFFRLGVYLPESFNKESSGSIMW